MAIRTMSILNGFYTALQGYWDWDESKGFVFISRSRPDLDLDQPLSATSISHDNLCIQAPHNSPSSSDTGETETADCSFGFRTPAIGDETITADDDTEPSSLDSSLSSIEFEPPSRLQHTLGNLGLGISGLLTKDGSGPFTGLGIVSVRSSSWRSTLSHSLNPSTGNYGAGTDISDETRNISNTILKEALLTWTDGPLHTQALEPIPEREFWCSTESGILNSQHAPTRIRNRSPPGINVSSRSGHVLKTPLPSRPRVVLTRNLTLPTISSKLKRVSRPNEELTVLSGSHPRSCLFASELRSSSSSAQSLDSKRNRTISSSPPVECSPIRLYEGSGFRGRIYPRLRTVSVPEVAQKRLYGGLGMINTVKGKSLPRWR